MNDRQPVVLSLLDDVVFVSTAGAVKAARPVFSPETSNLIPGCQSMPCAYAMAKGPDLRRAFCCPTKGLSCGTVPSSSSRSVLPAASRAFARAHARGVASRDVELSIRTKTNATAGVKLRRRQVFDDHFAIDEPSGASR
jgi:hypothetical protein